MDGDGQHLAEEIPHIVEPVLSEQADIVIGSRYLSAATRYKTTLGRRIGQKFFGFIFLFLTKQRITDPTSGFQCLSKRAMSLFANGHFPDDYPDTDILLVSHYAKLVIREIPVQMRDVRLADPCIPD